MGQIERLLPPRLNGSSRFRKQFLAVDDRRPGLLRQALSVAPGHWGRFPTLPRRVRSCKNGESCRIGAPRRFSRRYLSRCSGSLFADVPDPHSDGMSPHQFHLIWSEDAERFVGFRFLFAEAEAPCVAGRITGNRLWIGASSYVILA